MCATRNNTELMNLRPTRVVVSPYGTIYIGLNQDEPPIIYKQRPECSPGCDHCRVYRIVISVVRAGECVIFFDHDAVGKETKIIELNEGWIDGSFDGLPDGSLASTVRKRVVGGGVDVDEQKK